jgi:hypothetical protein
MFKKISRFFNQHKGSILLTVVGAIVTGVGSLLYESENNDLENNDSISTEESTSETESEPEVASEETTTEETKEETSTN